MTNRRTPDGGAPQGQRQTPRRSTRSAKTLVSWGGGSLSEGDLVVVDTAPLIYVLEDHPLLASRFHGLFEAFEAGHLRIAITTITVAEVMVGPLRHDRQALASRCAKALAGFEVTPLTAEMALTAARLRATTGLKLPDAIQAATALELSAKALVTHDRDFSRLRDLPVLTGAD